MICDMCRAGGTLYRAEIEGAVLTVCHECSKFGKVVGIIEQKVEKTPKTALMPEKEVMEIVVKDYADKIKKKREELGLKQGQLAHKINEKESLVQKIESGNFEPSIGLAKKIGKFLKIKLVEEYEEIYENQEKTKTGALTIGDMIKIKK